MEAVEAGMVDFAAEVEDPGPGGTACWSGRGNSGRRRDGNWPAIEPVVIETRLAQRVDPAAGIPQVKQYDEFDIAFEVERLLRNRNWERRDEPFDGFKSPPGRF